MFTNKTNNKLIKKAYIRGLKTLTNNFSANTNEIFLLTEQKNIHESNLQKLAIDIFKCLNNINPKMMSELFQYKENNYNLRKSNLIKLPDYKDPNSWLIRAVLLWNNLSDDIKGESTKIRFQQSLQDIKLYCRCKICS